MAKRRTCGAGRARDIRALERAGWTRARDGGDHWNDPLLAPADQEGGLSTDLAAEILRWRDREDRGLPIFAIGRRWPADYGFVVLRAESLDATRSRPAPPATRVFAHPDRRVAERAVRAFERGRTIASGGVSHDGSGRGPVHEPRFEGLLLVVDEKHGRRFFSVPRWEDLGRAAVALVRERLGAGWYDPGQEPSPPGITEAEAAAIPDPGVRAFATERWERHRAALANWRAESRLRALAHAARRGDPESAVALIFARSGREHESVEIARAQAPPPARARGAR